MQVDDHAMGIVDYREETVTRGFHQDHGYNFAMTGARAQELNVPIARRDALITSAVAVDPQSGIRPRDGRPRHGLSLHVQREG